MKMAGAPESTRHFRTLLASAANDLARLDARGAHVQALALGHTHLGVHGLDVRVPPAVGTAVGVRDQLAEAGSLATDVAHGSHVELLWIWVIEMSPDALGNSTIVTTGFARS